MKLINIFLISFLLSCNAYAFWGASKTMVLCYIDNELWFKYTYEVKEKDVIQTTIFPANQTVSKKDEMYKMEKLEDCTVSDPKNWMCGGKIFAEKSGFGATAAHKMLNGKYSFTPFKSSTALPDICEKRVQSN